MEMTMVQVFSGSGLRAWWGCVLTISLMAVGCGGNPSIGGPIGGSALRGRIHGGQQPVSGASIQLYAAGTSGYGTGATPLLTTPVTSDATGSFSITGDYTCPSATSQLYMVATGGNPGLAAGTNNARLALMAALGPCSLHNGQYTLDPNEFISINEATTVAAVYALRGFMTTGSSMVGASATNATGLANSFSLVNNLVDSSSGVALTVTAAGNGTAPQTVVNTLADIISVCVNSNGTSAGCNSLMSAATPSGGTAPADTIQAVFDVATNPANNVGALFGLVPATGPFQPTLNSAPNDWTMTMQYTAYGSSQGGLAIDAQGDIWVSNIFTSPTNLTSSVTEFSNNGTVVSGAAGFTGGGLNRPGSVSIDPAGNVWLANTFTPGLSKFASNGVPISGSAGYAVNTNGPIANDGFGNLWYATGIGAGKTDNQGNVIAVDSSASNGLTGTTGIAVDISENVWVSVSVNEYTSRTTHVVFSEVQKFGNDGTVLSGANGFLSSGANDLSGIAMDHAGDAWVMSAYPASPSVRKLGSDGTILSGTNGFTGGGLINPGMVAVDGAGSVWVPGSYVTTLNGNTVSTTNLVQLNNSGAIVSGASGYIVNQPSGYSVGVAVDGSGDLWLSMAGSVVLEVVGVATPVVTPLSLGVKNGTLGMRP
jgi:hypothetical protein